MTWRLTPGRQGHGQDQRNTHNGKKESAAIARSFHKEPSTAVRPAFSDDRFTNSFRPREKLCHLDRSLAASSRGAVERPLYFRMLTSSAIPQPPPQSPHPSPDAASHRDAHHRPRSPSSPSPHRR